MLSNRNALFWEGCWWRLLRGILRSSAPFQVFVSCRCCRRKKFLLLLYGPLFRKRNSPWVGCCEKNSSPEKRRISRCPFYFYFFLFLVAHILLRDQVFDLSVQSRKSPNTYSGNLGSRKKIPRVKVIEVEEHLKNSVFEDCKSFLRPAFDGFEWDTTTVTA